jgi:hypothetical protein
MLKQAFGDEAMSRTQTHEWYKRNICFVITIYYSHTDIYIYFKWSHCVHTLCYRFSILTEGIYTWGTTIYSSHTYIYI